MALQPEAVNISNKRENTTGLNGTLDYVISNQREKLAGTTSQTVINEEIYDDVRSQKKPPVGIYCKPSLVNSNTASEQGVANIRNRLEVLFQSKS